MGVLMSPCIITHRMVTHCGPLWASSDAGSYASARTGDLLSGLLPRLRQEGKPGLTACRSDRTLQVVPPQIRCYLHIYFSQLFVTNGYDAWPKSTGGGAPEPARLALNLDSQ